MSVRSMKRAVYRNLNKARRDPSTYVFSIAEVKGRTGKGKVQGHSDDVDNLRINKRDFYMANVEIALVPSTLRKIATQNEARSVCAWLVGDFIGTETKLTGKYERRFSINPKQGHTSFYFCDDMKPVGNALSRAVGVRFSTSGTYAIFN